MKRKFLAKLDWQRIINREDKEIYINNDDFSGNIHLIKMIKVVDKLVSNKFGIEEVIIDNNYTWISFLPDNMPYVITGLFNNNSKIVQIYVDIIETVGLENGKIYYDDIYIDVIMNNKKDVMLDDVDELEEAYDRGIITKIQFDKAYENAINMFQELKCNPDKWINLIEKYYKRLI